MTPVIDLLQHPQNRPRYQVKCLDMHAIPHRLLIQQNGPRHVIPMNLFIGHKEHINFSHVSFHFVLTEPVTNVNYVSVQS